MSEDHAASTFTLSYHITTQHYNPQDNNLNFITAKTYNLATSGNMFYMQPDG
jgi:hypothetical protein